MTVLHRVVGPDAGRGRAQRSVDVIDRVLADEGVEVVDLAGDTVGATRTAMRDAVAAGSERILLVGGDGLVHLAVQEVAGTRTTVGLVPLGTGNDYARALTGEDRPPVDEAVRRALGPARRLDAIRTERGWVASVATAGFSGDVNERANAMAWPRGSSRYTIATLRELPGLETRHVAITVDGRRHTFAATLIAVANTAWFGGGMHISPRSEPDDGLLELVVVGPIGRLALLRYFPRVFSGRHLSHPATTTLRGSTVTVEGAPLPFWGDGEPLGPGPLTLEAVPEAIAIAV